jgi:hypothetical protein
MQEEMTKAQINEAQAWIRDCSWLDRAEDLEDLTDEQVRRGIDSPRESVTSGITWREMTTYAGQLQVPVQKNLSR